MKPDPLAVLARELREAREEWQSVAYGAHFREGAKDGAYLRYRRAWTRYMDAREGWDVWESLKK